MSGAAENWVEEWGIGTSSGSGPYWVGNDEAEARAVAENSFGVLMKRLIGPWVEVTDQ